MTRALKIYTYTGHSSQVARALGSRPHISQVRCVVAAHTQKQAAALLGTSPSDMRHFGGTLDRDHPEAALALASPGQVFARGLDDYAKDGPVIKVGVAMGQRTLVPGMETDIEHGVALLAHEEAEKARFAAEKAERLAGYEAERARREMHRQQSEEALEWVRPRLAELGVHPDTLAVGTSGGRVGILLPPETVAMLVEQIMGERYPGPRP